MSVATAVYAMLSGTTALTDLVPVSAIKPQGNWQKITVPYIIHFPISENPQHAHGAIVGRRIWSYQVSVFSSDFASGESIAAVLRSSLGHARTADGVTMMLDSVLYLGREDDTGIHHHALTFTVAEALGG